MVEMSTSTSFVKPWNSPSTTVRVLSL